MEPITAAEFAKIKGVSATAVHKAIASGRLVNCLVYDPKYKKPRINPVIAAQEWEQNTDHNKRHTGEDVRIPAPTEPAYQREPGVPVAPTSKQVAENYKARILKLKYDEMIGAVVDAETVKGEWFKLVTEAKTKILSIPSKAKANMPHLSGQDIEILDRLVREALEDLARGTD